MTDTLHGALALCFGFAVTVTLTVLLSALIPRRVPFLFRILSYSVIGALVYIPAALAAGDLFPETDISLGYPLLITSLLLTGTQMLLLEAGSLLRTLHRLICAVIGACLVILTVGASRELLGTGALLGHPMLRTAPLPVMQTPAAGILLTAVLCIAAAHCFRPQREEETDASAAV